MKWNVVITRGLLVAGVTSGVLALTGCADLSGGGRPAAAAGGESSADLADQTPAASADQMAVAAKPSVSAQKTPPPAASVATDGSATNGVAP